MRKLFHRVLAVLVFLQFAFEAAAKPGGGTGGSSGSGFDSSYLIAPALGAGIAILLWGMWYRYVSWRCPECKGRAWISSRRGKSAVDVITLGVARRFECTRCGNRFVKLFHF